MGGEKRVAGLACQGPGWEVRGVVQTGLGGQCGRSTRLTARSGGRSWEGAEPAVGASDVIKGARLCPELEGHLSRVISR